MAEKLDEQRLEYELRGLQGWVVEDGAITRQFAFADHRAAMDFISKVSEVCSGFDHCPDLDLVSRFDQVKVTLASDGDDGDDRDDDGGRVTFDDIQLARQIDALHGKV
jgi:pterin-4a-carbinolamine dehydratase